MEGSVDDVAEARLLRARVSELEGELRLRMEELSRLDRELRHARADVTVKDEFIAELTFDADSFQRLRNLLGRLPYGAHLVVAFDRRLRAAPGSRALWAELARTSARARARSARLVAGRVKRHVAGTLRPGS
jgi:hypothetical protein